MADDDDPNEETIEPGEAELPPANEVDENAARAEDLREKPDYDARQARIGEKRKYAGPTGAPGGAREEALPQENIPETEVEEPRDVEPDDDDQTNVEEG